MARTTDAATTRDFKRAEAELARRDHDGGLQFASVKHCLNFAWHRGPLLQGALSHHPQGELGPDGEFHVIRVDCRSQTDVHDLRITLEAVRRALVACKLHEPVAFGCLQLRYMDPRVVPPRKTKDRERRRSDGTLHDPMLLPWSEVAGHSGFAASTAAAHVGRAESFLLGHLVEQGVIVPKAEAA